MHKNLGTLCSGVVWCGAGQTSVMEWSIIYIIRIVNHKSKRKYIPTKMSSNDVDVIELKVIANTFNSYFAEIGSNLANIVPCTDTTPRQYLNNQTYDTFYLFPN